MSRMSPPHSGLAKPGLEVPGVDSVEGRSLRMAAGVLLRLPVRRAGPPRKQRWLVEDRDHGRTR